MSAYLWLGVSVTNFRRFKRLLGVGTDDGILSCRTVMIFDFWGRLQFRMAVGVGDGSMCLCTLGGAITLGGGTTLGTGAGS